MINWHQYQLLSLLLQPGCLDDTNNIDSAKIESMQFESMQFIQQRQCFENIYKIKKNIDSIAENLKIIETKMANKKASQKK